MAFRALRVWSRCRTREEPRRRCDPAGRILGSPPIRGLRPIGSHLHSQTLGVVLVQSPLHRVVPDVSPDGIQGRLTANDVIIEARLPGEITETGRPDTFGRDGFELAHDRS